MKRLALAALLAACHGHAEDAKLELPKAPAPFGPFAGIKFSMSSDQAIAALPKLPHTLDREGYGSIDWLDDKRGSGAVILAYGHVESIHLQRRGIAAADIVRAWAPASPSRARAVRTT